MRLLHRLRDDSALGHREVLAVPAGDFIRPHVRDGADHLVPHVLGVVRLNLETAQLGPSRGAAGAELEPAVGDDVERGGAFGDARRVIDLGQAERDALTDVDVLGHRGRGREEDLRRRRMAVLLEEMVLDLPDLVEAQFIGETDLLERLVIDAPFRGLGPGTLDGMLVEDAEFHS